MKKIIIGGSPLQASEIALGCMRMAGLTVTEAKKLISTAIDLGIDFFDHADVYGSGQSEEIFAQAIGMNPTIREKILLQSKCGIRKDGAVRYDFSKKYILESVDAILKRLKTDYLDVLLLHRPDTLVEPEEVAEAFDLLHSSGKVRHFGVSNQSPMLVELLGKYIKQHLIINQLQFSIAHTLMVDRQFNMNMNTPHAVSRDSEILEYCRLKEITIQAWSPFQHGFFSGTFLDNDDYAELNCVLDRIAEEKGVSKSAVTIAWIMRHPAKIQPIVGTTNAGRLKDICKAADISISREEWYEIYSAAGNELP